MSTNAPPTALKPHVDGRPPHLPCGPGDVAQDVLIPGDPDRVGLLTDMLEDVVDLGRRREFAMVSGRYKGHPITICSSGIGGPSTEIALVELAMLGAKRVVRIGGTASLVAAMPVGSFLCVDEAIGSSGAARFYCAPDAKTRADPELRTALLEAAQAAGFTARVGTVATSDSYYLGQDRPIEVNGVAMPLDGSVLEGFRKAGAHSVDMESQVVLSVGKRLGLKAACLLGVHANRATNEWLTDYEATQRGLFTIASQALIASFSESSNEKETEHVRQT
ncbi:nucleoside phosphorylase [Roseibium marinum]|uniref:Uridine phosphorylase n=1 Tax=Roseibium marinum TaxID=281252 RepID=A0A2S3UYA2_9HYPH|nr:nucleoside phosphorylase [Roseibium marinum]POF32687.1 uridine phosphorylase [Roseibium marinum]